MWTDKRVQDWLSSLEHPCCRFKHQYNLERQRYEVFAEHEALGVTAASIITQKNMTDDDYMEMFTTRYLPELEKAIEKEKGTKSV